MIGWSIRIRFIEGPGPVVCEEWGAGIPMCVCGSSIHTVVERLGSILIAAHISPICFTLIPGFRGKSKT